MPPATLTKSAYLQGLQCPKLLWVSRNQPSMMPPVDEGTQAVFDQGHEVGLLAQRLYAGAAGPRQPLVEADLRAGRLHARADILDPRGDDAWDLVEVKSGTTVKDPNLDDVAFQALCGREGNVRIARCVILHVNSGYVRQGEVDPAGLFTRVDVTDEVGERLDRTAERARAMLPVLDSPSAPEVEIGPQCSAPYSCPLVPMCWKHVLDIEDNIFTLARIGARAWPLHGKGILRNAEIPKSFRLTDAQRIQLAAERTGSPQVDREAVRDFLAGLEYPLSLLDFETFQAAVPRVEGTRPYQQVPFQFSLHVQRTARSRPSHVSWLWDGAARDPGAEMLDRLRAGLAGSGSIVCYNAGFEKARIRESVESHPGHGPWWKQVEPRVVDLYAPFRSFAVYFPSQRGSASMKQVLPAISGRSYRDLAIRDGSQASREFMRVVFGAAPAGEREKVFRDLEAYCGLDTLGMRDIIRGMHDLAS